MYISKRGALIAVSVLACISAGIGCGDGKKNPTPVRKTIPATPAKPKVGADGKPLPTTTTKIDPKTGKPMVDPQTGKAILFDTTTGKPLQVDKDGKPVASGVTTDANLKK